MSGTIAIFYHWADPSMGDGFLTRKTLTNDKTLYVCDDYWSWASPHLPEMELYEIDAVYKKPLILTGQFTDYEAIFSEHNVVNDTFLKKGGFDAVIYTPHPLGRGVRQIALLKPKDQVIAIRRVPNHEIDWQSIKLMREEQNRGWSNIMFNEEENMNNIYFTGKKVLIDGVTLYSADNLARAVAKLGGEVCQNPENADLIIYGKDSEIAQDTQPGTLYPNAITTWEGKVDDLVQELPNGIEDLF